jgi:hypothetical protein
VIVEGAYSSASPSVRCIHGLSNVPSIDAVTSQIGKTLPIKNLIHLHSDDYLGSFTLFDVVQILSLPVLCEPNMQRTFFAKDLGFISPVLY